MSGSNTVSNILFVFSNTRRRDSEPAAFAHVALQVVGGAIGSMISVNSVVVVCDCGRRGNRTSKNAVPCLVYVHRRAFGLHDARGQFVNISYSD